MDTLLRILPLLIPVLIVDSALAAAAVAHILRHPHYHFGIKPCDHCHSLIAFWANLLFYVREGGK